jgi:hypothetical protein
VKPSALIFLLCFVLVFSTQCSSSPPPTARDLNTAVNLSRDACRVLLDATEPLATEPEAQGGEGGGS